MPKPNTFLRKERESRGWSQEHLAELIESDADSVRNWETGRRGTSRYFQTRLGNVFELPPEQLGFPMDSSGSNRGILNASAQGELVPASSMVPLSRKENPDQVGYFLLNQEEVDENRHRMLRQIQRTWIDGVLHRFITPGIFLPLHLRELPEALANPWQLVVRETNGVARELPEGTSIVQLYDFANEELLILGEPGAGKTTLLLELTRELLHRAEQNEEYPIPVLFNLTSWPGKRLTLVEWLVEEMQVKYSVPREIAQTWLEDDRLIVLLDGLDEVTTEALSSCLKAIQEYQGSRVYCSLVICCRWGAYFAQEVRLSLQKAVLIQPLTREQIDQYLTTVDSQLETVRKAMRDDPEFEAMCTNPLQLNIVARAYQGQTHAVLVSSGSREIKWQHVFEVYVKRMLERRGMKTRYTTQQTLHWLSCLATYMHNENQPELYLERIQPSWLPNDQIRQRYRRTAARIIYGFRSVIVAGLFAWLHGGAAGSVGTGLLHWLGGGLDNAVWGWMARGIGNGLDAGTSQGLVLALSLLLITLLIGAPLPTIGTPGCEKRNRQRTHLWSAHWPDFECCVCLDGWIRARSDSWNERWRRLWFVRCTACWMAGPP